jgi:hypothetical protein
VTHELKPIRTEAGGEAPAMPSKSATVSFEELLEAYEFASMASEGVAWVARQARRMV